MVRKVILVLLVLAIAPLVVPSRASASHDVPFPTQTVSFQCVTVTRWQPVSQFVLSTNGVFVQVVKVEPVQQVQCFPSQIVQPVVIKKVIIKQNGNGHSRKFRRAKFIVVQCSANGLHRWNGRHRNGNHWNGHRPVHQAIWCVPNNHRAHHDDDDDDD